MPRLGHHGEVLQVVSEEVFHPWAYPIAEKGSHAALSVEGVVGFL